MSPFPPSIADYVVLPITIPPTSSYPSSSIHTIYLRQHAPKIPTPTSDRSLFLVNVPVDSTPAHLRAIFTILVGAGRFESISFKQDQQQPPQSTTQLIIPATKPKAKKRKHGDDVAITSADVSLPTTWNRTIHRSGSTAIVTLADPKSVEAVLRAVRKLHKSKTYPIWGQTTTSDNSEQTVDVPRLGSKRYLAHHTLHYPSKLQVQSSIDAFMSAFNSKEESLAREAKRVRNEPDEDGFVTVSRGGRTAPARREEAEEARTRELAKEEEKRRTMGDFYKFQGRERRKAEQGELIRKFEEDRRKVESLKAEKRGRFRPEGMGS